jgi:hypothetical protein
MNKNKEIHAKLLSLEKEYNINIIYACESGSRAWGPYYSLTKKQRNAFELLIRNVIP